MGDGERTREIRKERDVGDREIESWRENKEINKILYNLIIVRFQK